MRTSAEQVARIRRKLVDPNTDPRLGWTDARLLRWLNTARNEFAASTSLLFGRGIIQDVAAQSAYFLDGIVETVRCEWKNYMIPQVTLDEAVRMSPFWDSEQGDVFAYALQGRMLYKIKVPQVTSNNFIGEGILLPSQFAAVDSTPESTYPSMPIWADDAVELAVVSRAYGSAGPGQDKALSQHYRARYDMMVARAKDRVRRITPTEQVIGGTSDAARLNPRVQLPWTYGKRA